MPKIKTGAHVCTRNGFRLQEKYTTEVLTNAVETINEKTGGNGATPKHVAGVLGCHPTVAREKLKYLVCQDKIGGSNLTGRWIFWPKN